MVLAGSIFLADLCIHILCIWVFGSAPELTKSLLHYLRVANCVNSFCKSTHRMAVNSGTYSPSENYPRVRAAGSVDQPLNLFNDKLRS